MRDYIAAKMRVQKTRRAICGGYENQLATLCLLHARRGECDVAFAKLLHFGAHFQECFLKVTAKYWVIVSGKFPPHHVPEKTPTSVIEGTNIAIDKCDSLNFAHCVPGTSPPGSFAVFHRSHSVTSVLTYPILPIKMSNLYHSRAIKLLTIVSVFE